MGTSLFTADPQTFRAVVADVAARAKAILPESINGRLEGAVKLVLAHDVTLCEDGTIEVGSCTDPLKTYRLVGQTCECQDFPRAPEGWCRHRIAAGIDKRVREVLAQQAQASEMTAADDLDETTGDVVDVMPTAQPTISQPQAPLPEAPASVNVRLLIAGRDVQLTLRDTDEARLLERLATVLQQYPAPAQPVSQPKGRQDLSPQQHNALAQHQAVSGWCKVHGVEMRWNDGKEGRKGWFSHKTAEGWCKGR